MAANKSSKALAATLREEIASDKLIDKKRLLAWVEKRITRPELDSIMEFLGLNQASAADAMDVDQRTFRRWYAKPEDMPGPAKACLEAFVKCHINGLDWGGRIGWRKIYAAIGCSECAAADKR